MDIDKNQADPLSELRRKAEAKAGSLSSNGVSQEADVQRMLHELQVHQVELEMQNEELQQTQQELNRQLERSAELVEKLQVATLRAESASKAKSEFLAIMSHEIRNPMSVVIGMAQLLELTELTPEQREYLHLLIISGRNMTQLLGDILDFSKIEAHQLELERQNFHLRAVMTDTVNLLSLEAQNKGLTLNLLIEPDVPLALRGDAPRLRQIVTNLLSNAIKFTAGGTVSLHISRLTENDDQTTLRFAVRDSGIGIAADKLSTIFEPFTQADNSTTRKFGGTGLGLSISRQLAELMGGTLSVESVEGEGSVFVATVILDRQPAADGAATVAQLDLERLPAAPLPVNQLHILVAEDDPSGQFLLRTVLEKYGFRVTNAWTGTEVLELLEHYDFDLILMDCMMPLMSGYEATAAIKDPASNVRNHAIPVIALTGNARKEDRDRCQAAGMDDYLSKPFSIQALLEMVEKWTVH